VSLAGLVPEGTAFYGNALWYCLERLRWCGRTHWNTCLLRLMQSSCAKCIPIEKVVAFNLSDCLKILVYHNPQHIGQAQRVLVALRLRGAGQERAR
jgi:hypothetical protein